METGDCTFCGNLFFKNYRSAPDVCQPCTMKQFQCEYADVERVARAMCDAVREDPEGLFSGWRRYENDARRMLAATFVAQEIMNEKRSNAA
ncbi:MULTISPECIES: hypothetical protein [unclassified Sinorhizobium]|uniref:hypothetical protein n=1 Tax=unclassified Sinorhizobium TaxID=2613772 RepID=UPI0035269273